MLDHRLVDLHQVLRADPEIGIEVEAGKAGGGLVPDVQGMGLGRGRSFRDLDRGADRSGCHDSVIGTSIAYDHDFCDTGLGQFVQLREQILNAELFVAGGDDDREGRSGVAIGFDAVVFRHRSIEFLGCIFLDGLAFYPVLPLEAGRGEGSGCR